MTEQNYQPINWIRDKNKPIIHEQCSITGERRERANPRFAKAEAPVKKVAEKITKPKATKKAK